jgi:hypothetical protein
VFATPAEIVFWTVVGLLNAIMYGYMCVGWVRQEKERVYPSKRPVATKTEETEPVEASSSEEGE